MGLYLIPGNGRFINGRLRQQSDSGDTRTDHRYAPTDIHSDDSRTSLHRRRDCHPEILMVGR
mgnify:FL=1